MCKMVTREEFDMALALDDEIRSQNYGVGFYRLSVRMFIDLLNWGNRGCLGKLELVDDDINGFEYSIRYGEFEFRTYSTEKISEI